MMPPIYIVFLSGRKTLLWAMDIPHIADRLIGIVRLLHTGTKLCQRLLSTVRFYFMHCMPTLTHSGLQDNNPKFLTNNLICTVVYGTGGARSTQFCIGICWVRKRYPIYCSFASTFSRQPQRYRICRNHALHQALSGGKHKRASPVSGHTPYYRLASTHSCPTTIVTLHKGAQLTQHWTIDMPHIASHCHVWQLQIIVNSQ